MKMQSPGALLHGWEEGKMARPLGKRLGGFVKSENISPPRKPANPLLGIYLREMKTSICTKAAHEYF